MDIIINSLYTQKEIFLRELISNASDALDKIRFLAISNPDLLGGESELEIKIQYDSDRKIVEIIDNGIGMTKNDLIQNLGTVAKSGTTKFLENLKAGDLNLIGHFGVGFYSSFLVASKVEVISKHNDDIQHKWISSASNSFIVEEDKSVELKRGTIVRLHLKEDASEYCEYEELKRLVQRYSSFISYPIYLMKIVST
jgi:heat shock protein beta